MARRRSNASLIALGSALTLVLAGCGADEADSESAAETTAPSHHSSESPAETDSADGADETVDIGALSEQLTATRLATAKYVNDLALAQAEGYMIITPTIPDMGVHYLNPAITEFDPGQPPILVYVPTDDGPQLGALEWVFPEEPESPPLPGATYGEFAAACHFVDGTFVPTEAEADCASTNAETGSPFSFWHGLLVTMHVWLWFHNPDGLFNGTNPLVTPFTSG